MSRVVWKYAVPVDDRWYPLPMDGEIVAAGLGKGVNELLVWVLQRPDAEPGPERRVRVFGTGHVVPDGAVHRGTVFAGPFVWHLFEVVGPE
jgi:hypothetical protein